MLCQNCNKNEANVKYTQIVNGVKKQMILCDKCAKELGLDSQYFNMPIDFSSFLGDMFSDYTDSFIPSILEPKSIICNNCNMTYEEFLSKGKFGCEHCYDTFEDKINPLLKKIQVNNKHIGRGKQEIKEDISNYEKTRKQSDNKKNNEEKLESNKEVNTVEFLKERLKKEIEEERYEDAAITRDELKKLNNI